MAHRGHRAARRPVHGGGDLPGGPWAEAVAGLDAIGTFWEDERDGADEVFSETHEIVAVDGDTAVVRTQVDYGDESVGRWRDLWVIRFDAERPLPLLRGVAVRPTEDACALTEPGHRRRRWGCCPAADRSGGLDLVGCSLVRRRLVGRGCDSRGDPGGVGGAVGDVGRALGVELPAQHRDDLAAEQLQLVEHGGEGQAGVVHQEELALVVAEVLAEGRASCR